MKNSKKLLSIVLALVMIIGVAVIAPVTALAKNVVLDNVYVYSNYPIIGQNATFQCQTGTQYFIDFKRWIDVTDKEYMISLTSNDKFEEGKKYILEFDLIASAWTEFAVDEKEQTAVNVYINGCDTKVIACDGYSAKDKVNVKLLVTNPWDSYRLIPSIEAADFVEPVAGEHYSDTLTVPDDVILDELDWFIETDSRWMENEDVFEYGKEYSALAFIQARDGYKFDVLDGLPNVYVAFNGKQVDEVTGGSTWRPDDGLCAKIRFKVQKDISDWNVTGVDDFTYKGKALKHVNIIITSPSGECAEFTAKYKNNVNAGTATVILTGKGIYKGKIVKTFKINKAQNPAKVTFKKKVSAKANKKTTIKKAVVVKKAQGKVTYKTNNKKVKVSKGKLIVSKGLKKGKTIKVKITVNIKGNKNYKSRKIGQTIKIKVK